MFLTTVASELCVNMCIALCESAYGNWITASWWCSAGSYKWQILENTPSTIYGPSKKCALKIGYNHILPVVNLLCVGNFIPEVLNIRVVPDEYMMESEKNIMLVTLLKITWQFHFITSLTFKHDKLCLVTGCRNRKLRGRGKKWKSVIFRAVIQQPLSPLIGTKFK